MKEEALEMRYREIANYEDNPVNDVYAYVKHGDEIIATLYNNGGITTSNANGASLSRSLPMQGDNGEISGPALALARAEFAAKTLGGSIEITDTAQTQDAYENTLKPYSYINYAAMKNDPKYLELQNFIANKSTYESETLDDYLSRLEQSRDKLDLST